MNGDIEDKVTSLDEAKLCEWRLAVAAAPWHTVRYHLTSFKHGMTGKELLRWIQNCNIFRSPSEAVAVAIGEVMLHHHLFFQLNRRETVCAFRPTSAQQYVLKDPWAEAAAAVVHIDEANTLCIVSFAEMECRVGEGRFLPVVYTLDNERFDTPDALKSSIPLPSVRGVPPVDCEWLNEWDIVRKGEPDVVQDKDGWGYGVSPESCTDATIYRHHTYRRRLWQRVARVRPTTQPPPLDSPSRLCCPPLSSPSSSPVVSGSPVKEYAPASPRSGMGLGSEGSPTRILLESDQPAVRQMGLQRAAHSHATRIHRCGSLELFVTQAELSLRYRQLYIAVVKGDSCDWSEEAEVLEADNQSGSTSQTAATFHYYWKFRFVCDEFDDRRPVVLRLAALADPITRLKYAIGHAELFLDKDLNFGKAILEVRQVKRSHLLPVHISRTPTKCDKEQDLRDQEQFIDTGRLGYLHLVWQFTSDSTVTREVPSPLVDHYHEGGYLRVTLVRLESVYIKDSIHTEAQKMHNGWNSFHCCFPFCTIHPRWELMVEVSYNGRHCPLTVRSPICSATMKSRGSSPTIGSLFEFNWSVTIAAATSDPVVFVVRARRTKGRRLLRVMRPSTSEFTEEKRDVSDRWVRVGELRLSRGAEDLESSPGASHLRRHHLTTNNETANGGTVVMIHQWMLPEVTD